MRTLEEKLLGSVARRFGPVTVMLVPADDSPYLHRFKVYAGGADGKDHMGTAETLLEALVNLLAAHA